MAAGPLDPTLDFLAVYDRGAAFQADPAFTSSADSSIREQKLSELRDAMLTGTIDQGLLELLRSKLGADSTGADGKPS
jgi:hypothetical protein